MESVIFMYSLEGRTFGILWISLDNGAGIRLIVGALKRSGLQLLCGVLTQGHGESRALGRSSKEWLVSGLEQWAHECRQSALGIGLNNLSMDEQRRGGWLFPPKILFSLENYLLIIIVIILLRDETPLLGLSWEYLHL